MLKSIHNITLRDFSRFDKTGKLRYLRYIPLPFQKEKIKKLLSEISEGLSSEAGFNGVRSKEYHKAKSAYRIEYLVALYQAVYNLLINKIQVNVWLESVGREPKPMRNLEGYVEKIEKATGIKIKTLEDVKRLAEKITFLKDKFEENFTEEEREGLTFNQIVIGVFSVMNLNLQYDMYLSEFFELKAEAENMAKADRYGR